MAKNRHIDESTRVIAEAVADTARGVDYAVAYAVLLEVLASGPASEIEPLVAAAMTFHLDVDSLVDSIAVDRDICILQAMVLAAALARLQDIDDFRASKKRTVHDQKEAKLAEYYKDRLLELLLRLQALERGRFDRDSTEAVPTSSGLAGRMARRKKVDVTFG